MQLHSETNRQSGSEFGGRILQIKYNLYTVDLNLFRYIQAQYFPAGHRW